MRYGGFFHGFSFGAGFELTRRVVVPAILVATPLFLWWWLGPEKPSCDAERRQAARIAAVQVADRIHAERGDIRRAEVLHLANDPTDEVTAALRARLSESGLLDLDGTPVVEKLRNLLNLRNPGMCDVEEAIRHGKKRRLDAVVIGSVETFETVKGEAKLAGTVKFVRLDGRDVVDIPLTNAIVKDGLPPPEVTETMPLVARILIAAVCMLVVPVLAFPFLKLVMRRDSNLATAVVLALLLLVDGAVSVVLFWTGGNFSSLALCLVSLSAGFCYDLFMLSYAQLCRPAFPEQAA